MPRHPSTPSDTALRVCRQVEKRFSDFEKLHAVLRAAAASAAGRGGEAVVQAGRIQLLPELPGKVWLGNNFNKQLLEERRTKLSAFLERVVDIPNAASLACVREFLEQPVEVLMLSDDEDEDEEGRRRACVAAKGAASYDGLLAKKYAPAPAPTGEIPRQASAGSRGGSQAGADREKPVERVLPALTDNTYYSPSHQAALESSGFHVRGPVAAVDESPQVERAPKKKGSSVAGSIRDRIRGKSSRSKDKPAASPKASAGGGQLGQHAQKETPLTRAATFDKFLADSQEVAKRHSLKALAGDDDSDRRDLGAVVLPAKPATHEVASGRGQKEGVLAAVSGEEGEGVLVSQASRSQGVKGARPAPLSGEDGEGVLVSQASRTDSRKKGGGGCCGSRPQARRAPGNHGHAAGVGEVVPDESLVPV